MQNNVQKLRIEAGYKSAKEFAEKCNLKLSSYIHYENSQSRIPLENAVKIADTLDCSLDDLVNRDRTTQKSTNILKNDDEEYIIRTFKRLDNNDKSTVSKIILALSSLS